MRVRLTLATMLLLAMAVAATTSAGDSPRQVLRRIPIDGEGGWDDLTVDGPTQRLFVTHSTRVVVVDLARDSVIGQVDSTMGVHGVAIAPDLGRGFASDGRDSTVTMFDLAHYSVLGRVAVPGRNPDAIVYDPVSQRVFAFCGGSANAAVIEGRSGRVVGVVPLGGRPEFAVVDGTGRLFVNLEDSSAVVTLDTRTLAVVARWTLAPGEGPSGLAMDQKHGRLFAGCANQKLVVLDARNGRVVSTLPIGTGVDGVRFDATRGLVYSSNGEGTLTVIHEDDADHYRGVETVTTERGARTCALDPQTGLVYTATADFGPPPAPTPDRPHPRPSIVPGTFRVLVVGSR
ncbi:MAG: YncE family protein [Candidatus Eisenbacteria bacterium]